MKTEHMIHDWGDWEYKDTNPYVRERICKRCSNVETMDDRKELSDYRAQVHALERAIKSEWKTEVASDAELTWFGDHQVWMRPDGSSGEVTVLSDAGERLENELRFVKERIQQLEKRIRELETE